MALIAVIVLYPASVWLAADLTVGGHQIDGTCSLVIETGLRLTSEPHDHRHLIIVSPPVIFLRPSPSRLLSS